MLRVRRSGTRSIATKHEARSARDLSERSRERTMPRVRRSGTGSINEKRAAPGI
jgi:hypothetical protein